MTKDRNEMDFYTKGAVDSIKLWSKVTPLDNISTYKILPSNFVGSVIRKLNQ